MLTATDLKAAIATHDRTLTWMLSNDASYAEICSMLALLSRLRDRLLTVQRGTFAVGGKGAR